VEERIDSAISGRIVALERLFCPLASDEIRDVKQSHPRAMRSNPLNGALLRYSPRIEKQLPGLVS
jgi:hypothetical protein